MNKFQNILEVFTANDVGKLQIKIQQHLKALLRHNVLLLYGEMGVGKTTFTSQLASNMGSLITPSSPTFSIVNEYPLAQVIGTYANIIHMDLYRLKDGQEVIESGLNEYSYRDENFVIIEWPDLMLPFLEPPYTILNIESGDFQIRKYSLQEKL